MFSYIHKTHELISLHDHKHTSFTGPVIGPAAGPGVAAAPEAAAAPAAGLAATIAVAAATAGTRVAAGAGAGPAAETELRTRTTQPDRRLEKRKEEFRFKTEIAPFVHIRLPFELQFNNCITF